MHNAILRTMPLDIMVVSIMFDGIMADTHNPFQFGRELSLPELVDREEEQQEIVRVMLEGRKHFLVGPRRFGKTSVLAAASSRAEKAGAIVLRYNVEAFPSLDLLVSRMVVDTARRLKGPVSKVATEIGRYFATLRPSLQWSPADQTWTVALGAAAPVGSQVPLLVEALDGLERAAVELGKPVALVLDEFQAAVEASGISAEKQIRAAVQQHRRVGYVFAGSNTDLLAAMTSNPDRPFYRLGSVRWLGAIPQDEFAEFVRRGLEPICRVTEPGVAVILADAAEVPYNVQLLAHSCFEAARDSGGRPVLTPAFVLEQHRIAAARWDPVYALLWSQLTAAQQKALVAHIETGGTGLTSATVTQRHEIPVPSMQSAIEALENKGVLHKTRKGTSSSLRFEDPLFAVWIRSTIPVNFTILAPHSAKTDANGEARSTFVSTRKVTRKEKKRK